MKAFMILDGNTSFMTEVDEPQLENAYSVKVEVESIGICGTDLKIFEGHHSQSVGARRIPGHEFAGVVTEVGSAVTSLKPGDRVVHEPIAYCGKCYACRRGQGNVCRNLHVTGCNMSGGMEDFFVADERQWHKIPDWITWNEAALIEPYTIGAHVCARADLQPKDVMLILGAGPIGLMLADTAIHMGATVIISEICSGRLELARRIGAHYVVDSKTEDVKEVVTQVTNGEGANIICDCAGLKSVAEDIVSYASPAGRYIPTAPMPFMFDAYEAMHKQLSIISCRLQMNQFVPVISRFQLYKEHADMMITDVFDFDHIKEAFIYADARHPETGKVVIRFNKH